jgi:hypothetical protein
VVLSADLGVLVRRFLLLPIVSFIVATSAAVLPDGGPSVPRVETTHRATYRAPGLGEPVDVQALAEQELARQAAEEAARLEAERLAAEEAERAAEAARVAEQERRAQPSTSSILVLPAEGCVPGNPHASFIYQRESGCRTDAYNAGGCRGLGQACPGSKLPCSDQDFACQHAWFESYALARYGSWEAAYHFWLGHHWW